MEDTSGQLDDLWEAMVAGDQEKASEIRSVLDQESGEDSALEIADLLQQLHQARQDSDRIRLATKVLEPGTIIGDYEILDVIGRGGMGVVYRATQRSLKRLVALKTIRSEILSPRSIRRFCIEAATIARLKHPHIVTVFDVGEFEGTWFYSMDWIEGDSLSDRIKSHPLSAAESASILSQVADAVAFAHQNKILHRDIKPSNILIKNDGQVFISDFGLARTCDPEGHVESGLSRLTQTGSILGTPSYLSPEQAAGQSELESPATDVYGLGTTLYESLCGRPPFLSRSIIETLRQINSTDPVPPIQLNPEISSDLNTICLKCLEKEPQQRYPDALSLRDDLERFLNNQPITARPAGWFAKMNRWRRREPGLAASLIGVLSLLLALLIVTVVYTFNLNRAYTNTKMAQRQAMQASRTARSQRDQTLDTLNQLVYHIHTELQKDAGNLAARRQLLEAAVEGFEKIVHQHDGDGDSSEPPERASVIARIKLGDVLVLLGEENRARVYYRDAIEMGKKILQLDANTEHQLDLATAWYRLGVLEITLENLASADGFLNNSRDILIRLIPREPGPALALYLSVLFAKGWALEKSSQLEEAIEIYLELSDHIQATFPQANYPAEVRRLFCNVNARLTYCFSELFQLEKAEPFFELFRRDVDQLALAATTGPSDSIYHPAWAFGDISKYLLRRQNQTEALKFSQRSLENAEQLLAMHPDSVQVFVDMGIARFHHAMVLRAMGDLEQADEQLKDAIETVESGPDGGRSDRARLMLPFPFVFRMEFSQRKLDYDSALEHCQQATRIMESLEVEGKLTDPAMKSALTQTRRLETAFQLIPDAIKNVDSIEKHPNSLASLLYIYCCDYFESRGRIEQLLACGIKLLELESDDQYQFAIHMNSLARACCRAAADLPADSALRPRLIQQAFDSLRRSIELNPGVFNAQLDTEPDLAVLRNENGFESLVNFYQEQIRRGESSR